MLPLTAAQRRALRARSHHLRPVVMIGEAGLTPAVLSEVDANLKSHELIKIRVLGGDRKQREWLTAEMCRLLGASPVQHIGKNLVVFRPCPEELRPARGPISAKRRTKHSTLKTKN